MQLPSLALVALVFGALAVAAAVVARSRLLALWRRVWSLEHRMESLNDALRGEIVELRKSLVIEQVSGLRLPPRMPSQHGEDILLWKFFGGARTGFFVEAGAYDGLQFSNTYFLEAAGWSGLLVEPNPLRFEACRELRRFSRCTHAALVADASVREVDLRIPQGGEPWHDALGFTADGPNARKRVEALGLQLRTVTVPATTLDELLSGQRAPIQLLSLDLEGGELDALRGIDLDRWQPEVVLIEENSRGVDSRLSEYLSGFGYVERQRLELNTFYLRSEDERRFSTL